MNSQVVFFMFLCPFINKVLCGEFYKICCLKIQLYIFTISREKYIFQIKILHSKLNVVTLHSEIGNVPQLLS